MTSYAASWKQMVLRSMPLPAWLDKDAPDQDVAVSTRVRVARNLHSVRFPHHLTREGLISVQSKILDAATASGLGLEAIRQISEPEREYLLGCRLISPDYDVSAPGRVLLLSENRDTSIMVNEEDHLRIQVLTGGWSLSQAKRKCDFVLETLGHHMEFAVTPELGALTASPSNAGPGTRNSVLVHLIGLAQSKRLAKLLSGFASQDLFVRGVFGESSRAVGAFFQISSIKDLDSRFPSQVADLIQMEREARSEIARDELEERVEEARTYITTQTEITYSSALRILSWLRWAGAERLPKVPDARQLDCWLAQMDVKGNLQVSAQNRLRATTLRALLDR